MPHKKILDKLKIELMMDPATLFYTSILFSLENLWDDTIPTACTNGVYLKINPVWFMTLSGEEQIGLVLHEVMHTALETPIRQGTRDPKTWNDAADYVINNLLIETGYTVPACGLFDTKYLEKTTEQVYDILIQEKQDNPGGIGITNGMGGDVIYPSPDEAVKVEAQIINTIMRAKTQTELHGKGIGSIPGGVLIILDKTINPKLPWNVILQNHMHSYASNDYSWARPNRRYFPDFYLPRLHSESLGHLGVAVDSSGSVEDHEFDYFIAEITTIQQTLFPTELTLLDFDTTIKAEHKITSETNIYREIKFQGRGGTCIEPIIEWIEKRKPEVMLIFTDGRFHQYDVPKSPTNIIWLIHDNPNFTINYGKVIHYEINQ